MLVYISSSSVVVSNGKKTARVGGGAICQQVLDELERHDLVTPTSTSGVVGFAGWAALGGYGPCRPLYGMGLDQILGARLVDARGHVFDADDDTLECIRGAGGNFGVIVEMTVKVYPLRELHFGSILYSGADDFVYDWLRGLERLTKTTPLPSNLLIVPGVLNIPGKGRDEMRQWLSSIEGLAPVLKSDVNKTTPFNALQVLSALLASEAYGESATVSLSLCSQQAARVIATHVATMPEAPGVMVAIHSMHGDDCEPRNQVPSVFQHRIAHLIVEIVGMPVQESCAEAATTWATELRRELASVDNALSGAYMPLTSAKWDPKVVFGEHYGFVMALKEKHDPERVFRHANPSL